MEMAGLVRLPLRRQLLIIKVKEMSKKVKEKKEKVLNVVAPDGYEIDRESSTLERIVFRKIDSKFSDYDGRYPIKGWFLSANRVEYYSSSSNADTDKDVFATEKIAKSALAMAQISQIMANDERFGGVVTDDEWKDVTIRKYVIERAGCNISCYTPTDFAPYHFLAFHTKEQGDLFLEENEKLVLDYLMLY